METLIETASTMTIEAHAVNYTGFVSTDTVVIEREEQGDGYFFHDHLIAKALETERMYLSEFSKI